MEELIESYFDRLWPLCRSITGNGLRESLNILQEIIPLELSEIPTGKEVFDWVVPKEWNIKNAYIITPTGKKICDFKVNNLHVVNYSIPVNRELDYKELENHLYSLPSQPNTIPYVTSYYKEDWGFCLSHNELMELPKEGKYLVVIDSTLQSGSLTYGDYVLKGETDQEVLVSTYVCHPSMANNELSGPLVAAFLYKKLLELPVRKYTYRFVFAPETIGIIAYLDQFGAHLKEKLIAGYVVTCAGDSGSFTYKRSKEKDHLCNRIAEHILSYSGKDHTVVDFTVGGSDERQYCSPGFNLPVGSLMRTMYKKYKEYHTSNDNKNFISFKALEDTIEMYFSIVRALELNDCYKGEVQYCEPMLGKRDLYNASGSWMNDNSFRNRLLHFLSFADGSTSLLKIANDRKESILNFEEVVRVAKENGLLTS